MSRRLRQVLARPRARASLAAAAAAALLGLVAAGCGSSNSSSSGGSSKPVVVGASISLSGDFSDPGEAVRRGYQLWADYVNTHGGLLGRKVQLKILSDGSSPQQVVTNYQQLITTDHADLLLGPFSTFLTKPASAVAHRYGYAFFTGLGGGPSIVAQGFHDVFNAIMPVDRLMDSFAQAMLAEGDKPRTAAYVTLDDPFTKPVVDRARQLLEAGGVKTVDYKVYPSELKDYSAIASSVANAKADVVVAGSGFPDLVGFVQAFRQQSFSPKALISAGGADEPSFIKAVGAGNAEGVLIPGVWSPSLKTPLNDWFVNAYVRKYGGTPEQVSVTSAQAFVAAQLAGETVEAARTFDQPALVREAYARTYSSILGPIRLDPKTGENAAHQALQLQWQHGGLKVVLPQANATAKLEYPKPAWSGK